MSGIIIYPGQDGKTAIQLRAQDGSVWLTQIEIAELFLTTKQNVSLHIKNVLQERELEKDSVVKESFTTAADGKNYKTLLYNLEMILAKNYLNTVEVDELNRIVVMFLDFAEDQTRRRKQLTLADWRANVGRFLEFNERNVLRTSGTVSHADMKQIAENRYETFDAQRRAAEALEADRRDVEELEAAEKELLKKQGGEGE